MRKLIILIIFNLISINQLFADSRIIGKWLGDDGSVLEFLDGFQVSVGPILITDNDGNVSSGDWKLNNDNSISVTIGWSEDVIELMSQGISASNAINNIVSKDDGREHRQISAIDTSGRSGIFSGSLGKFLLGKLSWRLDCNANQGYTRTNRKLVA